MVILHIKLKGMNSNSNIKANIVPLYIPLAPGVGSKGKNIFFSESGHVDIKLNGIKHKTTCKQRFCPYTQMGWGQKIKTFFYKGGNVVYQ